VDLSGLEKAAAGLAEPETATAPISNTAGMPMDWQKAS